MSSSTSFWMAFLSVWVLVLLAAGATWLATGANRGWTKTSVPVKTLDEVTGIVYVTMVGACGTCPSSTVTLKAGIERIMRGHPFVRIPRVHTGISTRRVLVSDHLDGQGFEVVRRADATGWDVVAVREGWRGLVEPLFEEQAIAAVKAAHLGLQSGRCQPFAGGTANAAFADPADYAQALASDALILLVLGALTPFLGKVGLEGMIRLRERVVSELTTTFASHYTHEVSLAGAIDPAAIAVYAQQATGQKFLIRPTLG